MYSMGSRIEKSNTTYPVFTVSTTSGCHHTSPSDVLAQNSAMSLDERHDSMFEYARGWRWVVQWVTTQTGGLG